MNIALNTLTGPQLALILICVAALFVLANRYFGRKRESDRLQVPPAIQAAGLLEMQARAAAPSEAERV